MRILSLGFWNRSGRKAVLGYRVECFSSFGIPLKLDGFDEFSPA